MTNMEFQITHYLNIHCITQNIRGYPQVVDSRCPTSDLTPYHH